MRKIRELLQLKYERGLPHRAIARACGMGAGTVSDYLGRAQVQGLSWPLAEELDDGQLEAVLFPRVATGVVRTAPDFGSVHQELKRPGVTLMLLWMEYRKSHPEGYGYSRFCELYQGWRGKLKRSMRQVHRAGEKTFVDFAGKKPHLVDPRTGEWVEVELFVGVLGASSYFYAEATRDQSLESWVSAHVHMVEYFGGSTELWVPDNLRSGVSWSDRYEPEVNRTYQELARHYGAAVVPARVGKPKDKAKVEVTVLLVERWVLARLRNRVFFSLGELNPAIRELMEELNARLMKKLQVSRRELFEKVDRPRLQPLPAGRYEMSEWKLCRVNIDYHVEPDSNYYSVPYPLSGERVEVRLTSSVVEVFYRGRRVGSHRRLYGRGGFQTLTEHMPAAHREYLEWTPSRLVSWAEKTGPATAAFIGQLLERRPHPEQGYRSCLGILQLGKRHDPERLEAACVRAAQLGSYTYRTVKNILAAGLDRLPLEPSSGEVGRREHENIRGASYYEVEEVSC